MLVLRNTVSSLSVLFALAAAPALAYVPGNETGVVIGKPALSATSSLDKVKAEKPRVEPGAIVVHVRDANGAYLKHVLVEIENFDGTGYASARTDANGAATFKGLAPGNYKVIATFDSGLQWLFVSVKPGATAAAEFKAPLDDEPGK